MKALLGTTDLYQQKVLWYAPITITLHTNTRCSRHALAMSETQFSLFEISVAFRRLWSGYFKSKIISWYPLERFSFHCRYNLEILSLKDWPNGLSVGSGLGDDNKKALPLEIQLQQPSQSWRGWQRCWKGIHLACTVWMRLWSLECRPVLI